MMLSRRLFLAAPAAVALPATVQAAPSRAERIKHHLYALRDLCEDEFDGHPWQVIACTTGDGLSRILGLYEDDKLHDPYGIIGPKIRYGVRA
jgi:hypothetical protein